MSDFLREFQQCLAENQPVPRDIGEAIVGEILSAREGLAYKDREIFALISESADMLDKITRLESRVELQAIALREELARRESALTCSGEQA